MSSSISRIPADTAPGAHRIEVRGLESGAVVSVSLTVLAAGSPSTGVRDLAATGSNALAIGIPLALGGAALLAGGVIVVLRARRKPDGAEA